jgi:hypothetical protein
MAGEPVSLVKAIQTYFGPHPNPDIRPIPEYKALSEKDKAELREMLEAEGFVIKTAEERKAA